MTFEYQSEPFASEALHKEKYDEKKAAGPQGRNPLPHRNPGDFTEEEVRAMQREEEEYRMTVYKMIARETPPAGVDSPE